MAMSVNDLGAALPYHEPDILTILIWSSFLLVLNVINHVFDRIIYVGLLGQILVGIAWGTPGGRLFEVDMEPIVVNLGYLGLLLMVYEGGLSTSFKSLKANFWLSSFVAITGIALPIGLSYVLLVLANATPLQAFAAGAALCSTSLGTTFTVMQTSGLHVTRLGVILTSAAMMDDVVGLVMVQVISNFSTTSDSFNAVTVVRPIFVSLAFGLVVPVACRFVVLPLTLWANSCRTHSPNRVLEKLLKFQETVFLIHTALLIGMVTSATYAGTSNLFAAYLVGAAITWWDSDIPHNITAEAHTSPSGTDASNNDTDTNATNEAGEELKRSEATIPTGISKSVDQQQPQDLDKLSGCAIFEKYYSQPLIRILKPFFFASVGFSIPITRMFAENIIWRGLIYTLLMFFGKFACGLWLVRISIPSWLGHIRLTRSRIKEVPTPASSSEPSKTKTDSPRNLEVPLQETLRPSIPVPLYPGAIVGCAMVARGEIGFLISSLAEANAVFGDEGDSSLFLIVTWAIMLCTMVGPVCVGLVVKRLKKLSAKGSEGADGQCRGDVLGVWGVS